MAARLAELGAAEEDVADPEDTAEQVVEYHATRGKVAPQLPRRKHQPIVCEVIDDLAFNQRQVAADALVAPVAGTQGVAVPDDADAANDPRPRERHGACARRGSG